MTTPRPSQAVHQVQPFKLKLALIIGAALLAAGLFSFAVYDTVTTIQIHGPLYVEIVQGKDIIADVLPPPLYIIESYLVTLELLAAAPQHHDALIRRFHQLRDDYVARQAHWHALLPPGDLREALSAGAAKWATEFYDDWETDFLPALRRGDRQAASGYVYGPLSSRFEQHRREIMALVTVVEAKNEEIERHARRVLTTRTYWVLVLGTGLLGIIFSVGWLINRNVSEPLLRGLRDSEERTRSIVESALDAVIVMDGEGRISDWNHQAERMFGSSREEVLGERLARVILPSRHHNAYIRQFQRRLSEASGRGFGELLDVTALRRDGTEFPIEIGLAPVRLASQTVVSAFIRDISERKQAEGLKTLEHEVSTVLAPGPPLEDAGPVIIAAIGRAMGWDVGAFWSVDDALESLSTIATWQAHPETTEEFVSITKRMPLRCGVGLPGRVLAQGEPVWIANVQTDPNFPRAEEATNVGIYAALGVPIQSGTRIHAIMEFFCREELPPDERLLGTVRTLGMLIGYYMERWRAEQALHHSEERLRLLVEQVKDYAILLLDPQGHVISWNAGAARIKGFSAEEIIGQSISRFYPPDAQALGLPEHLLAQARAKGHIENEGWRLRKDGSKFWAHVSMTALRDAGGKFIGFTKVTRDLTERKAAENALRDAKERAESAARAKSQFLATMSHEIRTPMNGVLGMTELLLSTDLNEKQRRFAETVHRSGETLLAIINDILDFSKIEAGKLTLEEIDFELSTLVEDVAELFAERAHKKGLELVCQLPAHRSLALKGDPHRLRQILSNLVSNALKFTEQGEVAIQVAVAQETAHELCLDLSVRDTGIGIPLEAQGKIFDSFSQADGSTTRKYGGTGLGLAIIKQLAHLMGGDVRLVSAPGQGATFTVSVPLAKGTAVTLTAGATTQLTGIPVLIIDDNATNRDILMNQTGLWGMTPEAAGSAAEGFALLQAAAANGNPYPVVLLDWHMPGEDGLSLAKRIMNEPHLGRPHLVLLSSGGLADPTDIEGLAARLTKPIRQHELRHLLLSLLGAAQPAQPDTKAAPKELRTLDAHVLLAEDNLVNQELARAVLESFGCRIDIVDNGREAVDALAKAEYDLVLMDCMMPEMDGFEATRLIRERESTAGKRQGARGDRPKSSSSTPRPSPLAPRRIPIIAMTANALEGDRERCLAAGMDDYLSKPFKQEDLHALLSRWVSSSTPTQSAQRRSA